MSNEQYQEKENRGPLGTVETVVGAALAVGAGAALIYRDGGNKYLSDATLKRAGRVLNGFLNETSTMAKKDFDLDTIRTLSRKYITDENSIWKTSADDFEVSLENGVKKRAVYLNDSGPDNAIESIRNYFMMRERPESILSPMYNDEMIKKPLYEKYRSVGANNGEVSAIEDFINEAVNNPSKFIDQVQHDGLYTLNTNALQKKFKDTSVGLETQQSIISDIVQGLEEKNTGGGLRRYVNDRSDVPTAMAEQLLQNMRDKFAPKDSAMNGTISRAATFEDILAEDKRVFKDTYSVTKGASESSQRFMVSDNVELIRKFVEDHPEMRNLVVDKSTLRVDKNGELYSTTAMKTAAKSFMDEFADTIPGKLLKARDILSHRESPSFMLITGKVYDPILAHAEGNGMTAISDEYVRILNKTYKINGRNSGQPLSHVEALDNSYLILGEHGTQSRQLKMMTGDADMGDLPNNKFLAWLDTFSSGTPTKAQSVLSAIGKMKDPRWIPNTVKDMLNNGEAYSHSASEYQKLLKEYTASTSEEARNGMKPRLSIYEGMISHYYEDVSRLNHWMSQVTSPLSREAANKLAAVGSVSNSHLFEMLKNNDDDMIRQFVQHYVDRSTAHPGRDVFANADLISLANQYVNNKKRAVDSFTLASDRNIFGSETKKIDFAVKLRREIAKEAFIQEGSGRDTQAIFNLIDRASLDAESKTEAHKLAVWSAIQNATNLFMSDKSYRNKRADIRAGNILELQSLLTSQQGVMHDNNLQFQSAFLKMVRDNSSIFESGFAGEDINVQQGNRYNQWIHMNKSKSIIGVLNGDITAKAWAKQFGAGRKNMGDITTATMFPYFSMLRLMDPLNFVGLGFSARSTGSPIDLAKNIMLKRVLPVAGGIAALSYINDTTRQITGTSVTGALANSAARADLGWRRISDAAGITNWMKANRDSNVMSQYLNDDQDYQSYDERVDWYRNGYSPVRKGRWWAFGSTQEWRGGKIDYYQPNYLARANSDYYDVSVYGSSSKKWAHSWIPTPTHPLAPIRRLMDPYWLERQHYWDRPYPITGKMFGEGMPWSGPLNATVGQILKPQTRMHQRELGRSMVDVRDLISRHNQRIMDKASDNSSLVRIDTNAAVAPVSFVPYGNTTPGRAVTSFHIANGRISGGQYGAGSNGLEYNAGSFENYLKDNYGGIGGGMNSTMMDVMTLGAMKVFGSSMGDGMPHLSILDHIKQTPIVNQIYDGVMNAAGGVKNQVRAMNMATMESASGKQPRGMIVPDAVYKESARRSGDLLYNKEAMADIKNMGTKDYMNDTMYSAKQLLGMYGFALETVMPSKRHYRLAQADSINSFSRRFWGNDLGGWGGEVMEIARRFFPHENHALQDVNPIRNTQPEWMPEKFIHGDPYASIPKGEMRLPGKGYERMYKLHPDQFGRYGAYDRMKILADVAPYSQEYKIWRDIATKTVTDPALKKSIMNMRSRVTEQSKTHDFYNYRFIGNDIEKHEATVSKVLTNNTFQITGSDQIFKFAGISVGKDADFSRKLGPGTAVVLGIDKNKYNRTNDDGTFNAVVYIGGENLNQELLRSHDATRRKDDITAAGMAARTSSSGLLTGKVFEAIAHTDIPYIHDKFMRVETPLESYKRHHVYGTEYSTWNHPIQSMVMPELRRSWSQGLASQALSLAVFNMAKSVAQSENTTKLVKTAANLAVSLTNRGAFVGITATKVLKPTSKLYSRIGGSIGTYAMLGGYAATRLNNPIASALNFGLIGAKLGNQLIHDTAKGARYGAIAGLALSAVATSGFSKTKIFSPWIPKKEKKQWETEEYFDRLRYIKYMGLYHKASRKAMLFEHTNINRLLTKMESDSIRREKFKNKLLAKKERLSNNLVEGNAEAVNAVNQAITATYTPQQVLKAGKWTRAALAYRQAAESTMYGLKENATWAQILRALPTQDRDYVLEFAKEKDPKKRKKIEKYFSPYERRVLQTLWGDKVDKPESNNKFFATHQLPGPFWAGWKPDVDLDNVEIKAIKNEGLMLSDFGFYESEAQSPETKNAPTIDIHQQQGAAVLQKNLISALRGSGLFGVNVSVEPSSAKGIQMVANIVRTTQYSLHQRVTDTIGRIF